MLIGNIISFFAIHSVNKNILTLCRLKMIQYLVLVLVQIPVVLEYIGI